MNVDSTGCTPDSVSKGLGFLCIAILIVGLIVVCSGGLAAPILIGAGVGAIVSGGISAGVQYATTGGIDWGQVFVDAAVGGVMGAFGGSTIGFLGMTIAGGLVGFGGSAASDVVAGNPVDIGKAFGAMALGVAVSLLGGLLGGGGGAQNGQLGALKNAVKVSKDIAKTTVTTQKQIYAKGLVAAGNAKSIARHTSNLMTKSCYAIFSGLYQSIPLELYQNLLFNKDK
jgi:hypothetical protein